MAGTADNAAKARIISHMNNDHHDSIVRYLQHYARLSPSQAYGGRMTGVDLNGFTLQARGKTHRIPFHPPLTSYAQVREKAVELDNQSKQMLHLSDVTINKFYAPTGVFLVLFLTTAATWIGFSQRWWFEKGGPVAQFAGEGFAAFNYRIQPYFLPALGAAHLFESVLYSNTLLPHHGVNPRSLAYWLWAVSFVIEGQLAVARFKSVVSRLQKDKASK